MAIETSSKFGTIARRWGVVACIVLVLPVAEASAQRRRRPPRRPADASVSAPAESGDAGVADPSATAEPATTGAVETASPTAPPASTAGVPAPSTSTAPATATPAGTGTAPSTAPGTPDFQDPVGAPDLSPLRAEFDALMDEMVEARSRIGVIGEQLFDTRLRVRLQNRAGRDHTLAALSVHLDGAKIFEADPSSPDVADGREVFEGFAAPGPHVLTIEIEDRARSNEEYRTTRVDSFRFQVVRGRLIEVTMVVDDRSDVAENFAEDGEGEFEVRTRVRVASRELGGR